MATAGYNLDGIDSGLPALPWQPPRRCECELCNDSWIERQQPNPRIPDHADLYLQQQLASAIRINQRGNVDFPRPKADLVNFRGPRVEQEPDPKRDGLDLVYQYYLNHQCFWWSVPNRQPCLIMAKIPDKDTLLLKGLHGSKSLQA